MKNKQLFAIWLTSILLFGGCSSVNKNTEAVSLRIQSDKKVYQGGEDINITFEIVNNSAHPIKLLTDLIPGTNKLYMWTTLYFSRSDGIAGPAFARIFTSSSLWKIIEPYGTLKDSQPIGPFMSARNEPPINTLPPGSYNISAVYEFDETRAETIGVAIDKKDKDSFWFGKVISNTVPITIKPPK